MTDTKKNTEQMRKWRAKHREHYNAYQKEYKRRMRAKKPIDGMGYESTEKPNETPM